MVQNKDNLQSPEYDKRTLKCLDCKHYDVKIINSKGGTAKICKKRNNDHRIIVDLDSPNCTDYVYGW